MPTTNLKPINLVGHISGVNDREARIKLTTTTPIPITPDIDIFLALQDTVGAGAYADVQVTSNKGLYLLAIKNYSHSLPSLAEQITSLLAKLGPTQSKVVVDALKQKLKELEDEHEWEAIIHTPESQDFLADLRAETLADIDAGNIEDGGFGE